jgi:hypothetical protein
MHDVVENLGEPKGDLPWHLGIFGLTLGIIAAWLTQEHLNRVIMCNHGPKKLMQNQCYWFIRHKSMQKVRSSNSFQTLTPRLLEG